MAYPVLASYNTWFNQGNPSVGKSSVKSISIIDSIPEGSEGYYNSLESWDASAALDGSIHCYLVKVTATTAMVIIAGNGSGKIALNSTYDMFVKSFGVENVKITGANVLHAYPVLAPKDTWFTQGNPSKPKEHFIRIQFMDRSPSGEVPFESWDASESLDNSVRCYIVGEALLIVGNGSGKIAFNSTYDAFVKSFGVENIQVLKNDVLFTYPVLAPNDTWFTQGNPSKTKTDIEAISISYAPFPEGYPLTLYDASESLDGSIRMCIAGKVLLIAGNGSGKIALNPDSSGMFRGFDNVTEIYGADLFDTSNVTTFSMAFTGSTINAEMALKRIDVSTWDVSNCTNMTGMFRLCTQLEELHISNWDISKVTNMTYMFYGCNKLKALDVSKWNVSSLAANGLMGTFAFCNLITELDVSNWIFDPNVDGWMFPMLFQGMNSLKELNLRSFPFDKTSITMNIFYGCSSLETLKLPGPKLGKITSFQAMFENCSSLKNLDTSDWDVSGATNMSFMFYGCSALKEIDVSNWDVSKVTSFDHFAAHAGLVRKGIENWDTSSATNMNAMFHNCGEEELDLSGFKTDKVQFFTQMFENSPKLKRIKGMDKWNTSNATGFDEMFGRCYALEELDLSSFDTSKACNDVQASANGHKTGTFRNFCNDCRNLKWIKLGPNFAINGDGTNTTAEYKLILPTPDPAYIDGADGLWYVFNGDSFDPAGIPDRTANTYYSNYSSVADADVIVKNGSLISTAKAIKEKNGTTDRYTPAQFGQAIDKIPVEVVSIIESENPTASDLGSFTKLGKVSFPAATSVGDSAFANNTAMTSIDMPAVTSVGNQAFYKITTLTSVNLPAATSIGEQAFMFSYMITDINLPVVTSINVGTFNNCIRLNNINLPAVTNIGDYAFYFCRNLTNINLPIATSIGNYAFDSCSKLTSIDLPAVTSIKCAFQGCSTLETIILRTTETACEIDLTGLKHTKIMTAEIAPTGEGFIYIPASMDEAYRAKYEPLFEQNGIAGAYDTIFRHIEDYPEICGTN